MVPRPVNRWATASAGGVGNAPARLTARNPRRARPVRHFRLVARLGSAQYPRAKRGSKPLQGPAIPPDDHYGVIDDSECRGRSLCSATASAGGVEYLAEPPVTHYRWRVSPPGHPPPRPMAGLNIL